MSEVILGLARTLARLGPRVGWMLWAAPGTPGAKRQRADYKHETQECSPGRVVITAEHGEGSSEGGDCDGGDGGEDGLHEFSFSVS